MPARPHTPSWLIIGRGLVFALCATWLIGGPFVRGVLNQDHIKIIPRWEMFSQYGRHVCDVRYFEKHADDTLTSIDRFEVLGYAKGKRPPSLHRIESRGQALEIGRKLCARLGGPERDLRVKVRCGSKTRWKRKEWGKLNLCSDKAADLLGRQR